MLKQLEVANALSKNVVEVSLVWWIVDKLKMGAPSVVWNAKNTIIALLPTNRWGRADLVVCQKGWDTRADFLVIKSLMVLSAQLKNGLFSDEIEENYVNQSRRKVPPW